MGMIREFLYWLKSSSERTLELIGIFLVFLTAGVIITTWIYIISAVIFNVKSEDYCSWTPERPVTSVYWVVEWLPRKTTCFIWNKW